MEVILLQRVEKLGTIGDIVNVKDGYARNFLIPNKKCLKATENNKKVFEEKKHQLEIENAKMKENAEDLAKLLNNYEIVLIKSAGESGHLYGSVTVTNVAEYLQQHEYVVNKAQVTISKPIKTIGIHSVKLLLHGDVSTTVFVNVAKSTEEAAVQMQKHLSGDSDSKDTNTQSL